ncbi:MAG: ATP-dependent Clp protease adaptor ClpS [Planctomycetota bacterium]
MPSATQTPITQKATTTKPSKPKRRPLVPWHVILLDDDDHTYAYVIHMLATVCGHAADRAFRLAKEVDESGRVIVFTGHRELAELKREQILAFGSDIRIASSKGSMTAVLEKAR